MVDLVSVCRVSRYDQLVEKVKNGLVGVPSKQLQNKTNSLQGRGRSDIASRFKFHNENDLAW